VAFRFTYYTALATGVSVRLEGTNDLAGSPNPGGWTALTAAPGSTSPVLGTANGEAAYCCDYYPWIRVNPTTLTGTPGFNLIGRTYGFKGTSAGSMPPGSVFGGPFTAGNVVIGAGGQGISGSTTPLSSLIPYTGATTDVNLGNHGLFINGTAALAFLPDSIGTPAAPTVTQGGAGGLVPYAYKVAWLTLAGNGILSPATTTTTGNATLSVTNYNIINPGACPTGATGFIVDRTTGPNGTGTLPTVGVCGTPMQDIYPGPVNTAPSLLDLSMGLYVSQVTAGSGWFGDPIYKMSRESSLGPVIGTVNGYSSTASAFKIGVSAVSEKSTGTAIALSAVASSFNAATGANGVNFTALHAGNTNGTGPIYGGYGALVQYDNGNVPGWSAVYTAALQFSAGSGTFQHVAGFDCQNGWLNSPGTGANACFHNSQPYVGGGGAEYFLYDEGLLPSQLSGPLQLVPLAADPGCTSADYGRFWFDNTGPSTVRKTCNSVAGTPTWVAF
jgi:hypothetical protein